MHFLSVNLSFLSNSDRESSFKMTRPTFASTRIKHTINTSLQRIVSIEYCHFEALFPPNPASIHLNMSECTPSDVLQACLYMQSVPAPRQTVCFTPLPPATRAQQAAEHPQLRAPYHRA